MQYTSKIALLAVALFGTSVLAAPIAGINDDLSAREFYDMYLEARADSSLDARDLESLDFEARREYLDYLEARTTHANTTATEPHQTSLSSQSSGSLVEGHGHSHADHETSQNKTEIYLTKHQKAMRLKKKAAAKLFKDDPKKYEAALSCKEDKYHHLAVLKYLSKPKNLEKALENKESPLHHAAKRVLHKRKAEVYLSEKKNYEKALEDKEDKYHKDAVKMYLSHGHHFHHALTHKHALYHKAAVHEYLLDDKTRKSVLADSTHPFYKEAEKLQEKITAKHQHLSAGSPSPSNATVTSTTSHAATSTSSAAPPKKSK